MSSKANLMRALSAIDDAVRKLKRARHSPDPDAESAIKKAIRELDEAETAIRRALSDLDE